MNEDQIIDIGQQQGELYLTTLARDGLKTAANWSMVFAILGFIGVGFMVVIALVMLVASSFFFGSELPSNFPFPVWLFSLLYLGIAVLYFFPVMYLYQFSSRMKRALLFNEEQALTESCTNLGKHYKFLGIMLIVLLSLYFVLAIVMLVIGVSAAGNF